MRLDDDENNCSPVPWRALAARLVARPTRGECTGRPGDIADFERNARLPMRQNLLSIISTFEAAGILFIPESDHGEGVGVRFRKVELEYNRTLKADGYDLVLALRYKGSRSWR